MEMRRKVREAFQPSAKLSSAMRGSSEPRTEPHLRIFRQHPAQKVCKPDFLLQIDPVRGDFDPGYNDFPHPGCGKPPRFFQGYRRRHGAHMPAYIRDNAISTVMIATVLDFKQRPCPSSGNARPQQFKCVGVFQPQPAAALSLAHRFFAQFDHSRTVRRAADKICLFHRAQPLRVELCKTAAYRQHRIRIIPAQPWTARIFYARSPM